jgi:hypothetical protein
MPFILPAALCVFVVASALIPPISPERVRSRVSTVALVALFAIIGALGPLLLHLR